MNPRPILATAGVALLTTALAAAPAWALNPAQLTRPAGLVVSGPEPKPPPFPWAEPEAALHGRCLAQYVQQHMANRLTALV